MKYNYSKRDEVPEEYRWDLTKWFQSDEDWYKEYNDAKSLVASLNPYKGHLFQDNNLYHVLHEFYQLTNRYNHLYAYAMLKQDEDLSVQRYNKMYQEIMSVFNEFEVNTSYITPEILQNKDLDIDALIKRDERLEKYRKILVELKEQQPYIKDAAAEEMIAILTKNIENYENISAITLNSCLDYGKFKDENGEIIHLNTGNYRKYITSRNRNIRKKVYQMLNKKRIELASPLGMNLISFMDSHASIAKIRGYSSSKEMFFKRDHIPVEIQESLRKYTYQNVSLLQKYYQLYRSILGVKKLKMYDLSASVETNSKFYTVEDAQNYVIEATKVLGDDYTEIVKKGIQERWIDYMPYKGKQSGGYSLSVYPETSNILLSFNGVFDNVSTIAHEMGHAVNAYFAFSNNELEYAYHDPVLGEIASLSNEIYLASYVINHEDFSKEEKISVIIELLRTINSNFFGAVMENELEEIVYQKLDNGEVVTSDDLSKIMDDATDKFYGDMIEKNEFVKYMWIPRSHYYRPYYLYKYATSICGAVHFATSILNGDKKVHQDYKDFLKEGSSLQPNEVLLKYGIDLTKEEVYQELFDYYNYLLKTLEELVK